MSAAMKAMTDIQLAGLGLLSMSLNITPSTRGYVDLFTHRYQPQYVTADWLAQLERANPGVTVKFWAIVN